MAIGSGERFQYFAEQISGAGVGVSQYPHDVPDDGEYLIDLTTGDIRPM